MALRRASRPVAMALVVMTVLGPAVAAGATPHSYGEMVDYELTFPLDGANHFTDTFYAARSHGDHHAQDLMADKMVPVLAAASGTIRFVNWSSGTNPQRCCSVVITHDDGWETRYLHLNNDTPGTDDGKGWGIAPGLVAGGHVEAGQVIGWVGDSGNAERTPPHLHLELRDPQGTIVNPYDALRAAEEKVVKAGDPLLDGDGPLKRGSRGDGVTRLQEVLVLFGIDPGPIDGIFGVQTDAAVRAFQEIAGIEVDGVVGTDTRGAIADRLLASSEVIRRGDRGDGVELAQERLHAAGFEPGAIDGIFGPLTLEAVVAFQKSKGLAADGIVGPQTWAALLG